MRKFLLLVAVFAGLTAALPATASAHPLGNFTVNRYSLIDLERGTVSVRFVVDMAEIPTFQALGGGDTSDGRAVSYAQREAPRWVRGLELAVDGRPAALTLVPGSVHASLRPGQAGLSIMRAELTATAVIPGSGPYTVAYRENAFDGKVGWREIVVHHGNGVVLASSTAATRDVSDMLRHYPAGLLQTPLDESSASLTYRYGSGSSVSVAPKLPSGGLDVGTSESGYTSLVGHRDLTPGFVLIALLLAMAWGALHALSPGHGKSIVAAYLIGSRGTARHAAFLGATVTVTHTAGVVALGLVTLFLSQYIVPETLYPWLGLASGLIVVVMGTSILSRRIGRRDSGHHHHHHGSERHHHHDHSHDHGHGHSHLPPGADGSPITTRSMLALGVSGGILPCPSALVVMLGAIALHRTAFGLALVVAFSLGLALTLTSIGVLVVYAGRLVQRLPSRGGSVVRWIPAFSAAVITMLGVGLTIRALDTFPGGAAGLLRDLASPATAVAIVVAAMVAVAVAVCRRPSARLTANERTHP
jgi:nickel/cobalt transporter (NicO) family protein